MLVGAGSLVGATLPVIFCVRTCSHSNIPGGRDGASGTDHGRVAELIGEVELLRKQLADVEHELERLVIAGQVITQLTADDAGAAGAPQRGSHYL